MTPAQRRAVVADACARRALPVRRACRYVGVHRTLVRYRSCRPPQEALCARLRELAVLKPRWGSPRLTWRLRRESWPVNHKRVERLVREDRLLVGQRPRRKRAAQTRVPTPVPTRPDERWSMDFLRDTLTDGRPFRIWTLVDDATRECPLLLVDRSLPSARVVDALDLPPRLYHDKCRNPEERSVGHRNAGWPSQACGEALCGGMTTCPRRSCCR